MIPPGAGHPIITWPFPARVARCESAWAFWDVPKRVSWAAPIWISGQIWCDRLERFRLGMEREPENCLPWQFRGDRWSWPLKGRHDARQRRRRRPGLVLGAPLGAARPDGRESERVHALVSRVPTIRVCSEAHSRTCSMLSSASARSAAAMSEHDATLT